MTSQRDWPVAIIGSGNIGTDLMIKILRSDGPLTVGAMVGIDPASDGLARAARMGVPTTADGVDGLLAMPNFGDIKLVFDATSATAHRANWAKLRDTGRAHARPHPRLDRAVLRPGGQPRRTPRRPEPEHGDLRRAGHRADRRRRRTVGDRVLRRDRVVDFGEVRRAGHPRQHRRVHRNHLYRTASRRRSPARQGGDDHQPGRSAGHDAQHRLLPRRRRCRSPSDRERRAGDGRQGQRLCARLPAQATRRSSKRSAPSARCTSRRPASSPARG